MDRKRKQSDGETPKGLTSKKLWYRKRARDKNFRKAQDSDGSEHDSESSSSDAGE